MAELPNTGSRYIQTGDSWPECAAAKYQDFHLWEAQHHRAMGHVDILGATYLSAVWKSAIGAVSRLTVRRSAHSTLGLFRDDSVLLTILSYGCPSLPLVEKHQEFMPMTQSDVRVGFSAIPDFFGATAFRFYGDLRNFYFYLLVVDMPQ